MTLDTLAICILPSDLPNTVWCVTESDGEQITKTEQVPIDWDLMDAELAYLMARLQWDVANITGGWTIQPRTYLHRSDKTMLYFATHPNNGHIYLNGQGLVEDLGTDHAIADYRPMTGPMGDSGEIREVFGEGMLVNVVWEEWADVAFAQGMILDRVRWTQVPLARDNTGIMCRRICMQPSGMGVVGGASEMIREDPEGVQWASLLDGRWERRGQPGVISDVYFGRNWPPKLIEDRGNSVPGQPSLIYGLTGFPSETHWRERGRGAAMQDQYATLRHEWEHAVFVDSHDAGWSDYEKQRFKDFNEPWLVFLPELVGAPAPEPVHRPWMTPEEPPPPPPEEPPPPDEDGPPDHAPAHGRRRKGR